MLLQRSSESPLAKQSEIHWAEWVREDTTLTVLVVAQKRQVREVFVRCFGGGGGLGLRCLR